MSTLLNIGIILSATDALSPVLGNATSNLNNFDNKVSETSANLTKLGTASLAIGNGITGVLDSAFDDLQQLRVAQGELKTLGIEGSGLDAITKSAKEFSKEFSGTTAPAFVSAAYDIKSGISSLSDTAVGEFTAISALTGKATKSSTAQMTSLFATGFGIYREQFEEFGIATIEGWNNLSDEEKDIKFGEYFSAGIANSVQAFKTDGSNMSAALSNLGASATSAGISFAEQLSILGQLQATMSGSEAATKYRAFLSSVSGAGDKLDLQFTDANNQLLSMPEIIGKIKDKYGSTIDAIEADELKKAFGTEEAVSLIKLMYNETDSLTSNINKMNVSLQEGTKKTKQMAQAANEGAEKLVLDQKFNNFTTTIGDRFAPVMLWGIEVVGEMVDSVTSWMDEHETLSTVLISGIGIIGGLLTVLGTVGVVAGGVGMILPFLSGGFGLVTASMGVMATATKAVSAALLTNPIGLIATGIATAAWLIYDNWETLGSFFSDLWDGVKSMFSSSITFIQDYLGWTPLGMIINNWTPITSFFSSLWDGVSNIFMAGWDFISSIGSNVVDIIKYPFESFFSWIESKFQWVSNTVGAITDIVGGVTESVGNVVSDFGSSIGEGFKAASSFFTLEGGYKKEKSNQGAKAIQAQVAASGVSSHNKMIYENKNATSSKVVNHEPTYHITVSNPKSDVDIQRAVKDMERKNRNRTYEDLD